MELFYSPELNENQSVVKLEEEEFHHLSKVLRVRLGDVIYLTNGNGLIAKAELINKSRQFCEIKILNLQKFQRRKTKFIALVPILKQEERFEFALEKLTEFGIDEIQPFFSDRTIKKNFRFDRAKKILITAIKQSFNPFLPELKSPIEFKKIISELSYNDIVIYGDIKGTKILELKSSLLKPELERIILTVGPEGAFSEQELNSLINMNAIPVWLGEFRLRSETAIISLVSQVKIFFD